MTKHPYLMHYPKIMLLSMFLAVMMLASCRKNVDKSLPAEVEYAMSILWDNPAAAERSLERVNADTLPEYARACYYMTMAHAKLKTGREASAENVQRSLDCFLSEGDRRYAGEAAYVLGATYDGQGSHYLAASALKQAENLLFSVAEEDSVPDVLLGMVCYKLGMTFESDWLYKEANDYYRRALPYLSKTGYHLYIACTLRDIARTTKPDYERYSVEMNDSIVRERDSLFAEALKEASQLSDTVVYLDILDYAISLRQERDTSALIGISRYMTNVLRQPRYAGELADYYLTRGKLDSARMCLDLYAQDTLSQSWSRDRWHYLESRWLLKKNRPKEAYMMLEDLYENRQRQLVRDGQARTYTIARQYDVLKEQEKNLLLTVRQQRLYMLVAVLSAAVVIAALLMLLYYQRSKRKEEEQQTRIRMLDSELAARREALRRGLTERVELTRKMQLSEIMQGRRKDELPQWAQDFLEQNLLTSDEQWDEFVGEFNAASANLLERLKAVHGQLTKADLLIIALILTGLSIQDICVLLNQAKRTIWSRRQRIKSHLGLGEEDNLDEWLAEQLQRGMGAMRDRDIPA